MNNKLSQYFVVTGNYWSFTLTDGALRMLVVLYFHQLGYSPLEVAFLFLFYEIFGVITNLLGGYLGARIGLNHTMNIGLSLQIVALSMLLVPSQYLSVPYVMFAQALSGIAKDLNKMSAKSAIKLIFPKEQMGSIYRWVSILTGSKNALKGVGFFLGGLLLALVGFWYAIFSMAIFLLLVFALSIFLLTKDLGRMPTKPKFAQLFSKNTNINILSCARLFLFASRDVWFVVALPVYLSQQFNWGHTAVGTILAGWVIMYGGIQAIAPKITRFVRQRAPSLTADSHQLLFWGTALVFLPTLIALGLSSELSPTLVIVLGLVVYGGLFAINSSFHSFLIVNYANAQSVSMDVGFYYMANAMGRLLGTLLSGIVYQAFGLETCLYLSSLMIAIAIFASAFLPKANQSHN